MHSTHSHLITCSVIALSAYQTFAGHKDVQSELVARYLTVSDISTCETDLAA